jgi:dimethylglycine dehydrogenase
MYLRGLHQQLFQAGESLGIGNVGAGALLSMRLEKGFGIWGREFNSDYRPHQNEMHRYVAVDKGEFVGRDAYVDDVRLGLGSRLVLLDVAATTSDASGYEPVYRDDRVVGYVTSGGFGHRTGRSLALAYLERDQIEAGASYEVPLIGVRHAATLLTEVPFDPSGARMRS